MSGVLSSGVSKPGTGDIEGVTAGVGIAGGGSSGTVTVTLDLSELSAVTPTEKNITLWDFLYVVKQTS